MTEETRRKQFEAWMLGPIICGLLILLIIGAGISWIAKDIQLAREQEAEKHQLCESTGLPEVVWIADGYYCVGMREGQMVAEPLAKVRLEAGRE